MTINIDEKQCVVDVLLNKVQSHPCKDCGKCVFGYEGITQLEMILKDITEKKAHSDDKALLMDLCSVMKNQSMCDDGKEIASMVLEGLNTYSDVFDEHIAKKQCRAGVCKKFMTIHILAGKCIGCGECLDVCEDDAILGKKNLSTLLIKKNVRFAANASRYVTKVPLFGQGQKSQNVLRSQSLVRKDNRRGK